jgi:hypothetical protein
MSTRNISVEGSWLEAPGRQYEQLHDSTRMLDDPQALAAAYERDGYVFCRAVLALEEVGAVREMMEAELKRQGLLHPRPGGGGLAWSGKGMEAVDVVLDDALPARLYPELLRTPTTTAFLEKIFGAPVSLWHSSGSTLRHALPHDTKHLAPPHQDKLYIRHTDTFRTVWLPLVEIPEGAGQLALAEASHLNGHGSRHYEEQEAFSIVLKGRKQQGVALKDIPERWATAEFHPGTLSCAWCRATSMRAHTR